MARQRKRPSTHHVDRSDDVRVPIPTLVAPPTAARYLITPLGHVYREDGRLRLPTPDLKMTFNGGKSTRSLPLLVFRVFGHPLLRERWQDPNDWLSGYTAWVPKFGPKDSLTGRRSCTVDDVVLVPHGELISYGRFGAAPPTRLSILEPPP